MDVENRAAQERVEMESAMEHLRLDAKEREEELQRQLARARSDHLGEMRRIQVRKRLRLFLHITSPTDL